MNLSFGVKLLVLIICALVSTIIGMVAGFIHYRPTTPRGPAFLYGGGVFGGALTLFLVVLTSLGLL